MNSTNFQENIYAHAHKHEKYSIHSSMHSIINIRPRCHWQFVSHCGIATGWLPFRSAETLTATPWLLWGREIYQRDFDVESNVWQLIQFFTEKLQLFNLIDCAFTSEDFPVLSIKYNVCVCEKKRIIKSHKPDYTANKALWHKNDERYRTFG